MPFLYVFFSDIWDTNDLNLGNKASNRTFFGKIRLFSETCASILNPCQDGNVHTYTTTEELKKMAFRINSWNIKQAIDIQVTFLMEKKLQKLHFLSKNTVFQVTYASILNHSQDGSVHRYALTKEMKTMAFGINNQNTKEAIGIQVTFITEQNL